MLNFLREAGPLIFPIMILALVIGVLVLWNAVALLLPGQSPMPRRRRSINAVLFWGGLAAALGLLGQWIGIGKLVRFVAERGVVSPPMVVLGLSESLLTPVAGMFVLVAAGFLWFFLRVGLWVVERRA